MSEEKVIDTRILDDKYRPKTLDEIVGNEAVIAGIKAALAKDAKPHTWLLYGERGSGKTTISRILGRELGAHPRDVTEYNVSQMRGIDTAKEIIEGLWIAPLFGKAKVIILNEAHGGTPQFWECMLDVLESPPDHVYFVLCTTDVEKLKKTVQDRTITGSFKVKALTQAQSRQLLDRVIAGEGCKPEDYPEAVKKAIIDKADGIPRNIVKLLDKVFDIMVDKYAIELINDSVLYTEDPQLIELLTALKESKPWSVVGPILKRLSKNLRDDYESARFAVLGYFTEILLNSPNGNKRAEDIILTFSENFYDSKYAGFIVACHVLSR
jgi:DNA polymerase-3 subunit gamma/tau